MILVGDSIIQELENDSPRFGDINRVWRRYYAGRNAVNLGFGGDTTGNALWRLRHGEVDGIRPKLAIVLIGTNDIGLRAGANPHQAAAGVQEVVGELHHRLPSTTILVLGLLPRERAEQRRLAVNRLLAAVEWTRWGVNYIDVTHALLRDGAPDPALYRDPELGRPLLHPNADGWEAIAGAIEPQVAALWDAGISQS
jgi:lysophospholipase L1-like esterase